MTSAVTGLGIEEIFQNIGCKLFDPNYVDKDEVDNDNNDNKNNAPISDNNNNNNKVTNNNNEAGNNLKKTGSIKLTRKSIKEVQPKKKCC